MSCAHCGAATTTEQSQRTLLVGHLTSSLPLLHQGTESAQGTYHTRSRSAKPMLSLPTPYAPPRALSTPHERGRFLVPPAHGPFQQGNNLFWRLGMLTFKRSGRSQGGLLSNCRLTASGGNQRRNSPARIGGVAAGRQIGQDVAPLLPTACYHRQDMSHEATAPRTLGTIAGLAPLHGMPQLSVELSEEIAPPAGLQNRACHFHGTRLLS